jgi:hypothetical protein
VAARWGHEEKENILSRVAIPKTSRTQFDRLLNPKNNITLSSLQRAATIVGRRVTIELV